MMGFSLFSSDYDDLGLTFTVLFFTFVIFVRTKCRFWPLTISNGGPMLLSDGRQNVLKDGGGQAALIIRFTAWGSLKLLLSVVDLMSVVVMCSFISIYFERDTNMFKGSGHYW